MPREKDSRPNPAGGEMYRAGRPAPGARLLAVASLVRQGRAAADIGCDHGKLAVYLVRTGISPRVVAVDRRPLPLSRARALCAQCGVEKEVDCRLGDGLSPLAPLEAEEIVVAGLSGETIAQILAACPWLREEETHLVLQPAGRESQLRRWLCENGFQIAEEEPVLDGNRAYTTLSVFSKARPFIPDALFCEVGLLPKRPGPAAGRLLQNRLTDLRNRQKAPLDELEKKMLGELIEEVEACRNSLR